MSVRAYRINKIEFEPVDTFNFWQDEDFVNFLDSHGLLQGLNENGVGIIEVPVKILRKALKKPEISKGLKNSLKWDIAWAERNNQKYVQYYCF